MSNQQAERALRELVAKWRKQAANIDKLFPVCAEVQSMGKSCAEHADELEAALAVAPVPSNSVKHNPQMYATGGPVSGVNGTYTIAFLGCSCGWTIDGKARD